MTLREGLGTYKWSFDKSIAPIEIMGSLLLEAGVDPLFTNHFANPQVGFIFIGKYGTVMARL